MSTLQFFCPQITMEGSLSERVEALALLLPVSRPKLAAILRQRPALLTTSLVRHAQTIAELSNVMELPLFNAAILVAGQSGGGRGSKKVHHYALHDCAD